MKSCDLILTDSDGVQEEAPSLNKPVLVMRGMTERPEAVEVGTARLVGAIREKIVEGGHGLLDDAGAARRMTGVANPYGDGHAAARIVRSLLDTVAVHPGQRARSC